jgi:hypothetical protein
MPLAAVLLGVAFTVASIKSVPPPTRPTEPYKKELVGCRPPYRSP